MAYVDVDPQKLRDAAKQINRYIEAHRGGMEQINIAVNGMRSSEIGDEFDLLQQKWGQASGSGSTSQRMLGMLESYARYLNSCAENYEIAQENAKIRASKI